MAMNQIPPPEPMNCEKDDLENNWQFFRESFEDYRKVTQLDKKDESVQVATLKSVMGKQCKHILKQLRLSEADMANHTAILDKLQEHFSPCRNVLYDRYLFHDSKQEERETIEQYVIRVRQLAKKCKYGEVESEMIRDRLVLGAKDKAARTRLFREKECDLKKAIETLRIISETTTQQIRKISGDQEVHTLKQKSKYKDQRTGARKWESKSEAIRLQCKYCGWKHPRGHNSCPAYGKTCSLCSKRDHFASQCMQKKKKVHALQDKDSDSSDYEDLNFVVIHTLGQEPCKLFATMMLGKKREAVKFQLVS
ncbi:uncharacterized protein LOC117124619 [Anneissia japonica]|uniref:uncharacterized protein LOC117124619 n=1 Tax=Anneissia japonica TaxID=1529436 RepID=UPI0014257CC9|nr:uncharacterized protein LOC117124619 [Anneissia japonica]